MALTARQQRFVVEFLKDGNATQAAVRAGFSKKTANQSGPRLLVNVGVRTAIDEARAPLLKNAQLSLLDHVNELARLRKKAEDGGEVNAAITAEVARGRALGHQAGTYRPNLDDCTEAELEQVTRGELPPRLKLA